MSFTPITSLPSNLFPWWYSSDPGYTGINPCLVRDADTGLVLPNCTGWAWGAFAWHWGNSAPAQIWGWRNAGNWYDDAYTVANYSRGAVPKLGAIICFSNSGAGHVAVVEEVNSDRTIIKCSESDYSGNTFTYRTRYLSYGWNEYGYSHLTFQGFIYAPVIDTPLVAILKKKKKGASHVDIYI